MKLRSTHLLYAALAVGAVVWLLSRLGDSPEAQIRERFARVVELVEKAPGEGALEAAERARTLGAHFTPTFSLDVPQAGSIGSREALVRPFVGLRQPLERLEVVLTGVDVAVESEVGARLAARATVVATGGAAGGGPLRQGSYDIVTHWRRDGDTWRIESLRAVESTDR
ncbi:MAG: nuclear transport factor 2 family protein [Acidobacteriota bacterium]